MPAAVRVSVTDTYTPDGPSLALHKPTTRALYSNLINMLDARYERWFIPAQYRLCVASSIVGSSYEVGDSVPDVGGRQEHVRAPFSSHERNISATTSIESKLLSIFRQPTKTRKLA